MTRVENPLFGDGDEYELEGRYDPEADEGSYEERSRQALEAGDREEAIRIVEEGYASTAPTFDEEEPAR